MIQNGGSMRLANTVLALLQEQKSDAAEVWWVEAYSNGREQGYFLCSAAGGVAFARDQNEDGVVVYSGLGRGMFDRMAGNCPSRLCQRRLLPNATAAADFIGAELKRLDQRSKAAGDGRFGEAV
jgi:hypothetical protein